MYKQVAQNEMATYNWYAGRASVDTMREMLGLLSVFVEGGGVSHTVLARLTTWLALAVPVNIEQTAATTSKLKPHSVVKQ